MFKNLKKALLSFLVPGSGNNEIVQVVKTVYSPDGRRRVRFFHREEDGVCGFREEFFDDKILEMVWQPVSKEPAEEYPDMDSAIAAARTEVTWLHMAMQ